MRILGVDPGSLATGWGLIGSAHGRTELIDGGVIRLRGDDFAARLARLRTEFESLLERLSPETAAVESLFHGTHARAALQLAHARGVILSSLAGAGLEVAEYPPATIKKSVTDNGRASKSQVRAMVFRLLEARDRPAGHDLSDALAVALCHAACRSFAAKVGSPPRREVVARR